MGGRAAAAMSLLTPHLFPAVNLYLANRTDATAHRAVSAAFSEAATKRSLFRLFTLSAFR